jgi:hypothetical protein
LVVGGGAVAVALLGFVLMSFVGGGGGSQPGSGGTGADATPAPRSSQPAQQAAPDLRPGGRDPFHALIVASDAGAQPNPPAQAATPATQSALVEVVSVDGTFATVRVDSALHEKVSAGTQLSGGFKLEAIQGECAFIARDQERFRVCEGERFLR